MTHSNDRIVAIFEAALGMETQEQRTRYLDRTCREPGMRKEVESLLEAHENPDRIFAMETLQVATPPASGGTSELGKTLGGYRILRLLGSGGMGSVYEAEETESGRRIALKVLSRGLDSPVARQRFHREGLLAASVNHPNTVYVFGTDEIEGQPVIAMELVRGGTLQERIQGAGPMAVTDAVDTILEVISGLEAAAAKEVLHRDIKPSNCFVEADGTVKVGDFGLSISSALGGETKLTMTGSFMGTPAYCPPEQVRGDEYTLQGDLYAVGVTLYYLLTGQPPFQGDDLVRLLAMVLERPAESPAKIRPELPAELCRAVLRCLEKQPARRFRDYAELRNALLPFSSEAPTTAPLGRRFLAGCIDMMLLAAVSISLSLLSTGRWDSLLHPELYPNTRFAVEILGLALTLGYFSLLEGLSGASIGKRICGLRVASTDRGLPGIRRAALRSLIANLLPIAPALVFSWFSVRPWGITPPDLALPILLLLFSTARRRNGNAAVQDRLSRTRVFCRSVHQARPRLDGFIARVHPTTSPLHIGPYRVLEVPELSDPTELVLGFDEKLRREVWIRRLAPGAPSVSSSLQKLARPGRLRWLNGRRSEGECWDAYEAGPGRPLLEVIRKRQPWGLVRYWLLDLCNELAAAQKDGSLPAILALDRVWITADGRAKILDFSAPKTAHDRNKVNAATGPSVANLFLSQVAVASLAGNPLVATDVRPTAVQVALPPHARELLADLESGLAPEALADRLTSHLQKLATVSKRRRFGLIIGGFGIPLGGAAAWVALVVALTTVSMTQPDAIRLTQCLYRLSAQPPSTESPEAALREKQERDAFEIYVAGRLRSVVLSHTTWTSLVGATVLPEQRSRAERLIATRAAPTEAELTRASEVVEPYLKANWPTELVNPRGKLRPHTLIDALCWLLAFSAAIPGILMALCFRGGLVLRTAGLKVMNHDGSKSSRLQIVWRSLLGWSPTLLGTLLVGSFVGGSEALSWRSATILMVALLPAVGFLFWAALLPERGLQDRIAGTSLVPRD